MDGSRVTADWIAVDWGTTRLRAWAMDADGRPLDEATSDDGMGSLAPDGFEPALLKLSEQWLGDVRASVVVCGMAGARQGWTEAPYRSVPCAPLAGDPVPAPTRDRRIEAWILRGASQDRPADVMRGEETQIGGFLAGAPDFDGAICLPGTHSKWVHASVGEIVGFRTFMTGELFALLSEASVLRHSAATEGWDDDAFADALSETLSRPETLSAQLFAIRAESLLRDLPPAAARSRLSGLLIGSELAASRHWWLGRPVAVVGAPALASVYADALRLQGVEPTLIDGAEATLSGLAAARALIRKASS